MEITWFGTANLKIRDGDTSIHFDPFIPKNSRLKNCVDWQCDVAKEIFITHGHFDHLMDIPEMLCNGDYKVNCSDIAAESLIRQSADPSKINVVHDGQRFIIGSIEIEIMPGCHAKPGLLLFLKTFFSLRAVFNLSGICRLLKKHLSHPCGPVFVYHIISDGKEILHLGSLNVEKGIQYPQNVDLLMLPYQGCNDLAGEAIKIIEKIKPRSVLLHHFDDSFPPVSRKIDTGDFVRVMEKMHPEIKVYIPEYNSVLKFF